MAELNTVIAEISSMLSKEKDLRKRVVKILAEAFLGKIADAENIRKVQREQGKFVNEILRDLVTVTEFINKNQEHSGQWNFEQAKKIVHEEIEFFSILKEQFFSITKGLPIGLDISMEDVKRTLNLDQLIVTISRLNALVGNVKFQPDSEEYVFASAKVRTA